MALLTVPLTLARWWLSQDAVEHLAIAQAWVHGAGFVDPVKWILPAGGPSHAGARAARPGYLLLAAIPLGLGASLTTTGVLHAVWASGGRTRRARGAALRHARSGGLRRGAVARDVASPGSPSRATSDGGDRVAGLSGRAGDGAGHRHVCARVPPLRGHDLRRFLCRPNLIALALAVLVAGAAQPGVQRTARVRGLAIYALALAGFVFAYRACVVHAIGEAPYARYQTLFQVETTAEVWQYARADHGVLAYVASHGDLLATRAARTFADLVRVLFLEPTYHGIGWLALPGFAFALRSGERALERRFLALGPGTRVRRAPLRRLRPRSLSALHGRRRLAQRLRLAGRAGASARARALGPAWNRRSALGWAPLVLACGPLAISLPGSLRHAAEGIAFYREQGTQERLWPELDVRMRPLCRAFAPGERIASVDPWTTHLWCGHATTMLPSDLAEPGVLEVFLAQEQPDWLIAAAEEPALRRPPRLLFASSPRRSRPLPGRGTARSGRSRARAWNAPPPPPARAASSDARRRSTRVPALARAPPAPPAPHRISGRVAGSSLPESRPGDPP
ncbi:MAG: hypothetical protein IPK00_16120 [Deltaproteobacteria bacterium]|nr:hypothetical protein [Deltaproteobacteria bacterium]